MAKNLSDTMKNIILAEIGAAAVTTEKSKEILDDLVKRELIVEQGKVLNEELKHNVKKTFEDEPKDVSEMLGNLTPEQLAELKGLAAMESEPADEEAEPEE